MHNKAVILGLVACLGFGAGPALACKGKTILFDDDFKTADPGWEVDPLFAIDFGSAKLSATAEKVAWSLYGGSTFEEGDFCVDVTATRIGDNAAAGPIFWAADYGNLYWFALTPTGEVSVYRRTNNKWLTPVPRRKAEGAKTGVGATNTMRVTFKGNVATIYVNDKMVVSFKGQSPAGGGQIGLRTENDSVYGFSNLKITNVQ